MEKQTPQEEIKKTTQEVAESIKNKEQSSNIYTKLFSLQQSVNAIEKNGANTHFKYKYFDINKLIEAIKPKLKALGLVIIQPLTTIQVENNLKPALKTIILDGKTGEKIEDICLLPENNDPQKMGSCITYFRRYSLQSMLLLQAEDDDANLASGNQSPSLPKAVTKEVNNNVGEMVKQAWSGPAIKCSDCEVGIKDNVEQFSKKKYGRALCFDCQKIN